MVARELYTNRVFRYWHDELPASPPFSVDEDSLVVGYFVSAEMRCFLALDWPLPTRVLDLFTEYRNETNGVPAAHGRSLLAALSWHDITSITSEQKHDMRDRILTGPPFDETEKHDILDYCQSDVDVLGPLMERMLPRITAEQAGLGQALLRGRYMAAVARMESAGVPLDTATLGQLRGRWEDIKVDLIRAVDKDYGVFEGTRFKDGLFRAWLVREGIDWPDTATGRVKTDRDTFSEMAKRYPQVEPLKELRHALSELRLENLAVGADGRNRTLLSPFGASTGRNTPSNTEFIFGPSVWLRGLIQPPPGRGLAYIDWSAQEVAIAAFLSTDTGLASAVDSGDPYLAFARMAGLAPPEATKASHPQTRATCKVVLLGTQYGMQAQSLALRAGITRLEARNLLQALEKTFPVYASWAEESVDRARLRGHIRTRFGWTLHVTDNTRSPSLRNFPMQAHGAEMLRLACCLATERGVTVCAPIHDALLVEADQLDLERTIAATRAAMDEASATVLDGQVVATDVETITYPQRYRDERGGAMWDRVMELINSSDDSGPEDCDDRHDCDDSHD